MDGFSSQDKNEIVRMVGTRAVGHYRFTCPACSANRKPDHRREKCLSVEVKPDVLLFQCWHCTRAGDVQKEKGMAPYQPRPATKKINAVKETGAVTDEIVAYLKERGISKETIDAFGVGKARAYFPQLGREEIGVAFNYIVNGKDTGAKVRCLSDKHHVVSQPLNNLYGLDLIDISLPEMIIGEGEIDALSFHEAKIINSVSVPNGASSFGSRQDQAGDDEKSTYGFLWSAKDVIEKARRIVIATDNDDPGNALAEELARRIGRHKCWRMVFPEDCKDANDILLKHGAEKLAECVGRAEPWPISGVYEADEFWPAVTHLFTNGFDEKISTGLFPVDEIYSVAPGMLTIVTGIPGNGKSQIVDQFMVHLAREYGWSFGVCSFENQPMMHIGKLASVLLQKHFFKADDGGDRMTNAELEGVRPFINQHFKFLHQDDGNKVRIEDLIERIRTAVFRWGINGCVIDPYNYIARPNDVSETQWIDDMLTSLRLLAQFHGIHIWFVAHPTKMQMDADGNYQPPKGYSISGSAAWFSKADFGLTIHRAPGSSNIVRVINWKTRYDWLGKVGEAEIVYDSTKHIYTANSWMRTPAYGEEPQRPRWNN